MAIRWVTNDASGRVDRSSGIRAGGSTGTRARLRTGSAAVGFAAAAACRACELGPVVDAILDTIIACLSHFGTQSASSIRHRKGHAGCGWRGVTCIRTLIIKRFVGLFRKLA